MPGSQEFDEFKDSPSAAEKAGKNPEADEAKKPEEYKDTVSLLKGVHRILSTPEERRRRIRAQTLASLKETIPVEGSTFSLEVKDMEILEKDFSIKEQKDAILNRKSLNEAVKATLIIRNNKTGKVIDKGRRTIAQVPWMTPRHTFTVEGNEYSVSNQLRIKPGVYTRTRNNGDLEANFNLGRGKNFRIYMEPSTGIFFLQYDSTKIPLYPILHGLGAQDMEIRAAWNKDLLEINKKADKNTYGNVRKLYNKMIHKDNQIKDATLLEMFRDIAAAYQNTVLHKKVTQVTLGQSFDKVSQEAMLAASRKILRVFNKKEPEDDRDSLEFKTMHTVDTFFKERIQKNAGRAFRTRVKFKLNGTSNPTLKSIVPPSPFSRPLKTLITTSSLSNNPAQINPIEILDSSAKVTSLGEGGISSLRSVPDSARDQHGTHLGIIDPVRTPESGGVGVDLRATSYSAVDEKGDMFSLLKNLKTKKLEYVNVMDSTRKNIAFPTTDLTKSMIPVLSGNVLRDVPRSQVDYIVPNTAAMYSPSTNIVPGINGMQGNRAIMGSKQVTQALPLANREVPWVQVEADKKSGASMEDVFGTMHLPKSPVAGVVARVDSANDLIHVKENKTGKIFKVPYATNFPMASKTRLNHDVSVKVGDKVGKGKLLANSNFTKNGRYAGGTNLKVAYMAWKGFNSNDALIISEGAAKNKLSSEHMYRQSLTITKNVEAGVAKHRTYYGMKYTAAEYDRLNADGSPKRGAKIQPGEILIAAVKKATKSTEDEILGRLNKGLVRPYRDAAVIWEHAHEGVVKDVTVTPSAINVTVFTLEPMGVGDKLAGRHGNKGVVSLIIPDNEMPQGEDGTPLDLLLTSAGVVSRINPSQIIETALGKVAVKTGKVIQLPHYDTENRVKFAKALLKKHGIKDKETVTDPVTGRKIPNIMVGNQYMLKLFKSTETNYSARGIGGTDVNNQPTRGGDTGAKAYGAMDYLALVAHDARAVLREGATVKSDKNEDYWRRVQLGLPAGPLKTSHAFNKYTAMLKGGGINVVKTADQFRVLPMTDRDVDKLASAEVRNAGILKVKSNKSSGSKYEPETGGLFDFGITGGPSGTKWSKIKLVEPIVNPVFVKPARELLGMSGVDFAKYQFEQGGAAVKKRLNNLDLGKLERSLKSNIKTKIDINTPSSMTQVDGWARQLKYVGALKQQKMKPGDAYVISKVPVVPPIMRSVVTTDSGTALISDPNYLYKDLILVNQAIKNTPKELLDIEDPATRRKQLFEAVGAVYGANDPINAKTQSRGVKGFMTQIVGETSPKYGFFHEKLIKKRQQLSGRGTIAPDPSLALDQIGVPEDMLWTMYQPFTTRRLVQRGNSPARAVKMVEDRTPAARVELNAEIKTRPVIVNRAPTLHRFGLVGAYAVPVPGKTIRLNPFAEIGLNADYDGDAVQIHTPATAPAVEEVKRMTLSNLIFSDGSKDSLLIRPQHEAIFGAFTGTTPKGPSKVFKSLRDVKAAYNRGEIKMSTPIKIGR